MSGGRTTYIVFGRLASKDNDEIDAVGLVALKLAHSKTIVRHGA
jgi:hypothetical protein